MRTENTPSSLIVVFIGVTILGILAETQSSVAGSTTLSQEDGGQNQKSEENNLDHNSMRMNSYFVDKDYSMKFIPGAEKRRIGSEFLGKRTIPNYYGYQFEKRRALGSEFLGKRKLGSEFLGKRNFNQQQKNTPEDYQFYYSSMPNELDEDYNGFELLNGPSGGGGGGLYPANNVNKNLYSSSSTTNDGSDDELQQQQQTPLALNRLQLPKRGLGSEFLGKRDMFRPSTYNLINKWNRVYGPRLPIDHEKKRKLMGSEFLG